MPPTHFYPPGLGVFPWPTSGNSIASFAFAVPDDFATLSAATLVLVPKADVTGSFDVYGSVKRNGEVAGAGLLFNLAIPATLSAGTVEEIDVTALLGGQLDPTAAGSDYVSIFFWFPTSPALENATVVGLRFVYDAVRVATADIENDAVTNAKLADGSVGPNKVINNSLGSEQIQNQSLTGLDIANGSIGSADVDVAQVQARVLENCPPGSSIRLIGPAGGVTCETDTAGMTSYLRVVEDNSCGSNFVCIRSITCPGGRKAMGGGVHLDEPLDFDRASKLDVFESYAFSDFVWTVGVANRYTSDTEIDLYVVCSSEATGASSTARAVAAGPREDRPLVPR